MTSLPFLDNASTGKNNWWRYIFTIIFSLLIGIIAAVLIMVVIIFLYVLIFSSSSVATFDVLSLVNNPLFIIILLGISYSISLLAFYLCGRFLHKKTFISFINTKNNIRWDKILKGGILWAIILGLFTFPDLLFNPTSFNFNFNIYSFSLLLILSLLVFPIQAFFEEVFFRGYLMQGFSLVFKRAIIPVIVTSFLFGLMHFFNGMDLNQSFDIVLSTTIMGLMWGTITLADNGIELAAGSHIANNLFVALIFNPEDSGLSGIPSLVTSAPSEPFAGVLVLILAVVLFMGILFWNRKSDIYRVLSFKRD